MMKKLLILMLALGIESVSFATLSLSVNGDTSVETIEIPVGTTVWIGVCSDTSSTYWAYLELVDPFNVVAWVGNMTIHPAAGKSALVLKDPHGYVDSWMLIAYAYPGEEPLVSPGCHFEIGLKCLDYPDPIINLRDYDWNTVLDTLTINQIPEPASLIILGFGMLALRKRRRIEYPEDRVS